MHSRFDNSKLQEIFYPVQDKHKQFRLQKIEHGHENKENQKQWNGKPYDGRGLNNMKD